ncbi:RNA-binding S4 domain-containing protein [Vibrio gallicus]|uniref:RNA-binding S4 domain-containing protein n=1 Tax=Vibrio gallicus TaxID=190897 RepID=UPI0021C2F218|nr:RNA-binding S4 domain-containing protein [Vibrio gallicus]
MSHDAPEFDSEQEVEIEAIGVEVTSEPIELYKVLKIADAVSGGGEAKQAISQGFVAVNGELELRKRRKLVDGDLVQFNEEFYLVILNPDAVRAEFELPEIAEAPFEPQPQPVQEAKPEPQQPQRNPKSGRKSIDFF